MAKAALDVPRTAEQVLREGGHAEGSRKARMVIGKVEAIVARLSDT
ncbi:MAG: hypothetical protein JJ926_07870 [Roseitalea sp.]|jgi:hypothetical protein|nr:hypothetical protein [Roseitalea sp.]MBO6951783.1 hypothetical protein [Rhizobiaceae bacterium]MBO6592371.1 hypothetical protein [Roseitalea sp.]MBO6598626.1 hypothetical protein [Roseitalea sp.]MBO6611072.1 hypothetical protein [Roseitalea sp.]